MTRAYKRFGLSLKTQAFPSVKRLFIFFSKNGGRTGNGKINSYSKRGGCNRKYRLVDFKRLIWNLPAKILRFEKDPKRTSLISLICYSNGILSYVLSTHSTKVGQRIIFCDNFSYFKKGNTFELSIIPEGTLLHNVELFPGSGGILSRSAGTSLLLMRKFVNKVLLRLPSREEILVNDINIATVGIVSNPDIKFVNFYKAGQKRLLGYRPRVRGVARNPVDHPHGGGGGRCLVTFTAKVAKNKSTRLKNKDLTCIITSRKKVRRRKK